MLPFEEAGTMGEREDEREEIGALRPRDDTPTATGLTRSEILEATGITDAQLDALESFGILVPFRGEDGRSVYDDEALAVAEITAGYYKRGIEPRHLKMYWHFAQREAALMGQVLLPYVRQRNPASRNKLQEEVEELARLGRQLRTAMLRRALRDQLSE